MSVYSTNQARHLYVVADTAANEGWSASKDAEGNVFLKVKNADDELIRTDLMGNILSAKITKASALKRELNAVEISGNPTTAGAYTLGITYRQWIAASDETFYHEWASAKLAVAGTAPTTAEISAFYKALAVNLAKNTANQGMVKVYLISAAAPTAKVEVTTTNASTLTATDYNKMVIMEIEQKWVLGTTPQTIVYIEKDNIIAPWATVADLATATYITDGKEIADLEYFCLGERGDQYRGIGWPYITPTKGRVDSTKEYDVIDIHYAYVGSNEDVQKSEKTTTIAVLNSSDSYSATSLVNVVAKAINDAAGTTVVPIVS